MAWDDPKRGQEDFFPTNPDLANILGKTDLDFENFMFLIVLTPNFWASRSLDLQIPGFPGPDLQIPRFPGSQIPRFSDAAVAG